MTELRAWTFKVFKQYRAKFAAETASIPQAVLLCYIFCATEIAQTEGKAKWFTREVDQISFDLDLSTNAIYRELDVLRAAMLIGRC